jgi:hypothetical protein
MTVEEIFIDIINHLLKGVMVHDELANYYDFLALEGYSKCHEYHSIVENRTYRQVMRYYINRYNKFLPEPSVQPANIIPASWKGYTRQDVDVKTRQTAVKTGLEEWLKWEKNTKAFLQERYNNLTALNEIAAAEMVKKLIKDVDEELYSIEQYHLFKQAINYDMVSIINEQQAKLNHYNSKICSFTFE